MVKHIRTVIRILSGVPFALCLFLSTRGVPLLLSLSAAVAWGALVVLVLWRLRKIYRTHMQLPVIAGLVILASIALTSIVESQVFLLAVSVLAGGMVSYITSVAMVTFENDPILHKPVRRILTMIMGYVAYVTITFAFALAIFFPDIPFLGETVVTGALLACYTGIIWAMYDEQAWRTGTWWLIGFGVVCAELVWVMHLLPYGYFASGLLLAWLWYVFTLLGRFHMSPRGIDWSKQRWFLLLNLILYIATLAFFVRWV